MLLTAFITGFFGSLHCLGMCGPLVMAMPFRGKTGTSRFLNGMLYHSARIIAYALIGILLGVVGQGIGLVGWQKGLSVSMGIILLMGIAIPGIFQKVEKAYGRTRFYRKVKTLLARQFQKRQHSSVLVAGFLNGFVPCGLVYVAAGAALASGTVMDGAVFMMVFGFGTWPAMFIPVILKSGLPVIGKFNFQRLLPVFSLVVGLILIYRGLAVNIPVITPALDKVGITVCGG